MNKYFIILFALCCVFSFSQERRITRDANASFFNKDIAIEKYNEAIELNNDFNTAKFNLANSLYYEEDYEESINLLEDIISNESNSIKKANAYYNKGRNEVSLYEKSNKEDIGFLESATNSFREALKNNPNDNDTRFNLEKCLSILNELENQDSEEQKDKDKENQDSEEQKDKDKENQDSEEQKDKDKENQDSEQQKDKDKENQDSEEQKDKDKEGQDSEGQKDKDKEAQRDSKAGSTDGEEGEEKKQEIKASQINQILKAVENKEKEVQGKVKNINGVEIIPNIKKTEKDW